MRLCAPRLELPQQQLYFFIFLGTDCQSFLHSVDVGIKRHLVSGLAQCHVLQLPPVK
jgi:hypothetical protein